MAEAPTPEEPPRTRTLLSGGGGGASAIASARPPREGVRNGFSGRYSADSSSGPPPPLRACLAEAARRDWRWGRGVLRPFVMAAAAVR